MIQCLLVDDDHDIRSSLQAYLQGFAMVVKPAATGAEMRQLMATNTFDVIVLDLMLPDDNGLALCRWAQEACNARIIMLTAQGDPASRILGLEIGADDYIGKPFEPRELVARIHAVMRRAPKSSAAISDKEITQRRTVNFVGWTFDRVLRQLISPQRVVIALSSAEFRLLTAFVDKPGRVLSRDKLIDLTRAPGVDVNDRSIDLAVSRLRQKLGDSPRDPAMIKTMRGEGYLFDAQVSAS
jgi:two-component system OmpR family response regulator